MPDVPAPDVLFGLFGDNIHGPWYDYKVVGTDADGKDINHGYISINTTSAHYDENGRITDYPELMAAALMACLPMIVLYLIFQKQFIEGIATSGGKL